MKKANINFCTLTIAFCLCKPILIAQFPHSPNDPKPIKYYLFDKPSLREINIQIPQPYQFTPVTINTLPSVSRPLLPNNNSNTGNNYIEEQNRRILQQRGMLPGQINEQQQQAMRAEIERDFREIEDNYRRSEWLNKTANYRKAFDQLNQLYNGTFSLTNATYLVENAYRNDQLSYEMFSNAINSKVSLIKQILRREQLDSNSNLALNYGIQKLFTQSNNYYDAKTKQVINIQPFKYDFEDFRGEKDYTKMFAFKMLATGNGQCHSMPLVYLMIAEQLNAKAWLSLAPQHSFIQFLDNHNNLVNFETTNGTITSTNWLLQSGFINANAVKSKTYLDTLSQKQLFAHCLSDLLLGYLQKFGYDGFAEQIRQRILQVNPNNMTAAIIDANIKKAIAFQQIMAAGKPSEKDLPKHPNAYKAYLHMQAAFDKIDSMGYQDMPKDAYQMWLKTIESEKKKQVNVELQRQIQKDIQSLRKKKATFINKPKS